MYNSESNLKRRLTVLFFEARTPGTSLSDSCAAVGVELLAGNHQSQDVDAGSDPAVVGVLTVSHICCCVEFLRSFVMLLQRKIFNQRHTVDVVEDTHQEQLDDSPNGDNQTAERQFWSTDWHPGRSARYFGCLGNENLTPYWRKWANFHRFSQI